MPARFPLVVEHQADEPAHGLLLRTASHNGTRRFGEIFSRFGIKPGFLVNNVDPKVVATSCGANSTAVAHASPVATTKSVVLLGQTIHRDHYSVKRRRWCPECLKEEAYHRAWWDVVAITTCPKHALELTDDCGCETRAAWQTYGVSHCRSGHDMRFADAQRVAANDLVADRYLVGRLTGVNVVEHPLLDSLSLGDAIIALERLGQAWHNESGGLRRAREELGVRGLMNLGYNALAEYPSNFTRLLDRMIQNPRAKGNWGITKSYGEFYYWVDQLSPTRFSVAVRNELSAHAQANLVLKSGFRLADDTTIDNGYLLVEAAEVVGVAPGKFRRMAIELGLMPAEKKQGQPARLDRAKVQVIADTFRGARTLREVAAELGIAFEAVKGLVEAELLQPLLHAGSSGLNNYDFAAGAAVDLLGRIEAMPITTSGAGERVIALPLAAQQARITVAKGVRLILQGALPVAAHEDKAVGLRRYLVSASTLARVARQSGKPGLTMAAAATALGLPYNATVDFVKRGVITKLEGVRGFFIAPAEIEKFRQCYVTVPELSEIVGTRRSRDTIAILAGAGIEPACPRPPYWKVLYWRDQAVAAARSLAKMALD
jgi:hypothetical protein